MHELLNDDLLVGALQSLGNDIPTPLEDSIQKAGITLSPSFRIPKFRIDVDNRYTQNGLLATGRIVTAGNERTLFVSPQTLEAHADELLSLLNIEPADEAQARKLKEYALMQAMVHLTLQAIGGLSEEDIKKIQNVFTDTYI